MMCYASQTILLQIHSTFKRKLSHENRLASKAFMYYYVERYSLNNKRRRSSDLGLNFRFTWRLSNCFQGCFSSFQSSATCLFHIFDDTFSHHKCKEDEDTSKTANNTVDDLEDSIKDVIIVRLRVWILNESKDLSSSKQNDQLQD